MIIEFSRSVMHSIDEAVESIDTALTSGRIQNYETYREMVGVRRGLMLAREHLDERTRAYTEE